MTLNEYQVAARKTATYPRKYALTYLKLGLRGEVGEVCEKLKKLIRDYEWEPDTITKDISEEVITSVLKELGDVCWYIANMYWEDDETLSRHISATIDDEIDEKYITNAELEPSICHTAMSMVDDVTEGEYFILFNKIQFIAKEFGSSLEEVCELNIAKLASRQERDKLGGDGDNR